MARTTKRGVDQIADQLYSLQPSEFTAARTEAVKKLKAEDPEVARAIGALKKPSAAAWALNQVARSEGPAVRSFLKAGKALASAQENLVGGGGRAEFDEASAQERELRERLAAGAEAVLSDTGSPPSAATQEQIRQTLEAAGRNERVGELLSKGRLIKVEERLGLGSPARR